MFLARYLVDNHHDVHGVDDDLGDGGDDDVDVREDCQSKSKSSVREESLRKRRAMMLAGEQKVIAIMMMTTVIILSILVRWRVLLGERGAHRRATSATSVQSRPGQILTDLKMSV